MPEGLRVIVPTLRAILAKKALWLVNDSDYLVQVIDSYVQSAGLQLDESDLDALHLAAYYKNLGALYISDEVLSYDLRYSPEEYTSIEGWQASSQLITDALGNEKVSEIISNYYFRQPPDNFLASLFQVLNCWSACRTQKGWRDALSIADARRALLSRSAQGWSDPDRVQHFLDTFQPAQAIGQAAQID